MLGFRVRTRRAARAFGGREWSGGGGARGEFGFGSEGERERCWGCGIGKGRRVYSNGGIRNRICALPGWQLAASASAACGWSAGRGPQREVLLVSQAASLLLLRAHGCFVCVVFGVYTSVGVGVNGCLSGFSG